MARSQRRTALFYDAPLSTPEDIALLKAMLLFFDDIAVFSPPVYPSRSARPNLHLSAPLVERGLLQFVAPRDETRSHTEAIVRAALHRAVMEGADQWFAAASAGDWDVDVPRLQGRFSGGGLMKTSEPSASRGPGSAELVKLLAQEGLLFPDESPYDDRIVIPGVASVANSILAQAVRVAAREQGWLIEPVATRRDEAKVFTAILEDAVENVGDADVVISDFSTVTLDLCRVGLDDILDFRARHRSEFRAHVLALQALLASPTSGDVADRMAALADEAHRLREVQRRRWPKLGAGVSLGVIGATWTLGSADLLGALIGSARSQLRSAGPTPVSAYTYILRPDPELERGSDLEGGILEQTGRSASSAGTPALPIGRRAEPGLTGPAEGVPPRSQNPQSIEPEQHDK